MLEFRAYRTGADGLFLDRLDLDCVDQAEARAMAEGVDVDYDVELWERTRRIAVYKNQKNGTERGAG